MTSLSPRLYADLLGKPFAAEARGPQAYDCVGLALELQRRLKREVPDFISSVDELHRQLAAGGFLADAKKLQEPEAGCVALVRMGLNEFHLGTMLDPWKMLHTTAQTRGVVIERTLSHLWERRLAGFYRIGGARC